MKRGYRPLFILNIIYLIFISACTQNENKISQLRQENDSLISKQLQHDSILQEMINTFVMIDSNMKRIRNKESDVRKYMGGGKLKSDGKDSILDYMKDIQQLTESNKALVSKLEDKLEKKELKVSGVKEMVNGLHEKNENKDHELGMLKGELTTIHKDFRELFEEFVIAEARKMELNERNTELDERNLELIKHNSELLDKLNQAWYVKGTKNYLKEKGLVSRKGVLDEVLDKNTLSEELDKRYFTQVDIRDFHSLDLNAKKAELISKHPIGSYIITGDKKKAGKLIISDYEKFWSISHFLVIEIEP